MTQRLLYCSYLIILLFWLQLHISNAFPIMMVSSLPVLNQIDQSQNQIQNQLQDTVQNTFENPFSTQFQNHFQKPPEQLLRWEPPKDPYSGIKDPKTAWEEFTKQREEIQANSSIELEQKFETFRKNFDRILEHNSLFDAGKMTFSVQINQFADLRSAEIQVRNGAVPPPSVAEKAKTDETGFSISQTIQSNAALQRNVNSANGVILNWATLGLVSPVQNQAGAIEAQLAKKEGNLTVLSPQQLLDCTVAGSKSGCVGGWMMSAFDYVQENGITTSDNYPYIEKQRSTCSYNPSTSKTKITFSMYTIPSGNEAALLQALINYGPISAAIDAAQFGFTYYKSGIYRDPNCSKNVNHGVLITGYGTDPASGLDFWIVKNSWGTSWGESGYVRMARNSNNHCGIASYGQYPVINN